MEAIFQSFVTIGWWELCVTICNLLITFLIVKKFLFGPINKMLEARENEVRELYATAEADRTAAETMKRDYTASIANAKDEAAQITANAHQARHGAFGGNPCGCEPAGFRHGAEG